MFSEQLSFKKLNSQCCVAYTFPSITKNFRFEGQLEPAVRAIEARGFQLQAWTRLPYLCEGDLQRSFYMLDDVVMLFTKA